MTTIDVISMLRVLLVNGGNSYFSVLRQGLWDWEALTVSDLVRIHSFDRNTGVVDDKEL